MRQNLHEKLFFNEFQTELFLEDRLGPGEWSWNVSCEYYGFYTLNTKGLQFDAIWRIDFPWTE